MTSRLGSLAGWLLVAQGVVLGMFSFWAYLFISWVPDEAAPPEVLAEWDSGAVHEQAGAASAVLVLLSVFSVVLGVSRLLGHPVDPTPLVTVLVAAGAAVALFGSPVLAATLVLAAGAWAVVLRRDAARRGSSTALAPVG